MNDGLVRVEQVVRLIADTCIEQETYFSDLDSVVGDGDFGYSLARGFERLIARWDDHKRDDVGAFLTSVAVCLSARIGGTSGPIWGTAFLRAGSSAQGKAELNGTDVVTLLRAAVDGIQARGGAAVGDKTLLDALVPATDELERRVAVGSRPGEAARAFAETARASAEATTTLIARRGRASYSGERSIGVPDPGAIAMAVLAERIAASWPEPTKTR